MPTLIRCSVVRLPVQRCRYHQSSRRHRRKRLLRATPEDGDPPKDINKEGLLPEEDWTVPGGPNDSLSSNTPLGRAIRSAAAELEHLSKLENEVLNNAYALLEKLMPSKEDTLNKSSSSDDNDVVT